MNNRLVLGVDIGGTIMFKDQDGKVFLHEGAIETLNNFKKNNHEIYLISRVNIQQEIRSKKWLIENQILERIGINWGNLFYCRERVDKGPIAKALGVNVFIDDRVDCLTSMDHGVKKYLFCPDNHNLKAVAAYKTEIQILLKWGSLVECLN